MWCVFSICGGAKFIMFQSKRSQAFLVTPGSDQTLMTTIGTDLVEKLGLYLGIQYPRGSLINSSRNCQCCKEISVESLLQIAMYINIKVIIYMHTYAQNLLYSLYTTIFLLFVKYSKIIKTTFLVTKVPRVEPMLNPFIGYHWANLLISNIPYWDILMWYPTYKLYPKS